MPDNANGHLAEISESLKVIRGDINVLARRIDEMPARLRREFRLAAARDQARAATDLVTRLEAETRT